MANMVIQGMEFEYSKVKISPFGKHSWKKSDFLQFLKIEERGASEGDKINSE